MIYSDWTRDRLCARIEELETLLQAVKSEADSKARLDFPWTGNLGSWYWNVITNNVEFNPLKVTALGFVDAELPGSVGYQFFTDRIHPDDCDRVMENMREHMYGRSAVYECEYRIRAKDGRYKWFYDRGKVTVRDAEGKPVMVTGIVFDISDKKELEEKLLSQNRELEQLARVDSLTGLLNAHTIRECLAAEMKRAVRQRSSLAVALIDIDRFKEINDTLGHSAGDRVLQVFGSSVKAKIRETDIAGRYGGDEFLVLFPGGDVKNAAEIIQRIRCAVLEGREGISIGFSAGFASFADGDEPVTIISRADEAMYKEKGGKKKMESSMHRGDI